MESKEARTLQGLKNKYIAHKIQVSLATVKRARRRTWYLRFKRLANDLKMTGDFDRLLLVWRFLDDIGAFRYHWVSRSALESLMIFYQDGILEGKQADEINRLAFQEAV